MVQAGAAPTVPLATVAGLQVGVVEHEEVKEHVCLRQVLVLTIPLFIRVHPTFP